MKQEIKWLHGRQFSSGQFPTIVRHDPTGLERTASTLTPTYLIVLMLMRLRERRGSDPVIDQIIEHGLDHIESRIWEDATEGWILWHFNAFYPPDWEETCWCSLILHEAGRISKRELDPLRRLLNANETEERGVGVWVKDPYTPDNKTNNAFDPIVSLAVSEWLDCVFAEHSGPTDTFLLKAISDNQPSLYYNPSFQQFFYWVTGRCKEVPALGHDRFHLYNNARRKQLVYASEEVWRTAELLLQYL